MDKTTIIRLIVLIVALVNQILTSLGKNPLPFANETVYEVVSIVVTIAISLYTAWKNNNITSYAQLSQEVLNALKNGKITAEEVKEIVEEETK